MRYYSSTFVKTSIVGDISSTQTQFTLAAISGAPTSTPWTALLDGGTDIAELVDVTDVTGLVVTVTRGVAGTTPIGHKSGATFEHDTSHRDYQEPQNHIAASAAVHGLTGSVVGTSDVQTLTNKTLDGASNTFTNIPKTALANIDESQVTNLTTDLASKLNKPTTAFAKGSLPIGTGTGTYDTVPVGADGTVPTADSTAAAGVSWKAFGANWQSYTPKITDSAGVEIAYGNGTLTGRYAQVGKMVTVNVFWQSGTTTGPGSANTGDIAHVTLPVTPASGAYATGACQHLQASAANYALKSAVLASGSPYVTLYALTGGTGTLTAGASQIPVQDVALTSGSSTYGSRYWTFTLTYEAA